MSRKEKATREYLQTLSKEQVIDLCLQFMFDSEVTEKQLDQANEKIMWLNAEIDTLKSEKENLMRTLEEASEELECAIVPKFKIGQEVYSVFINRKYMECNEVCNLEITHIMRSKSGIFYQDNNKNAYWFNEKNTFLTEQEAKAKLQELRG